jgi:FkbM family methyltransferase
MGTQSRIGVFRNLPIVKPFPLKTFFCRLGEKIFHIRRRLSLLAARELGSEIDGLVKLRFRANCAIAERGASVFIPRDSMIFEYVKNLGCWAPDETEFLSEQINKVLNTSSVGSHIALVDLGANIGLSTLQVNRKLKKRIRFILVEPLSTNVLAIEKNLSLFNLERDCKVLKYALGEETRQGFMEIDLLNLGASHLVKNHASLANSNSLIEVNVKSAQEFAHEELSQFSDLFLKSDLEGLDCEVLSSFPDSLWDRVKGGVIEVIPNPNLNDRALERLLLLLSAFENISWDFDLQRKLELHEIREFWLSTDSSPTRNVFFSKK